MWLTLSGFLAVLEEIQFSEYLQSEKGMCFDFLFFFSLISWIYPSSYKYFSVTSARKLRFIIV